MKKNIAVLGCELGQKLSCNFYEIGCLYAVCDPNQELATKFSNEAIMLKTYHSKRFSITK